MKKLSMNQIKKKKKMVVEKAKKKPIQEVKKVALPAPGSNWSKMKQGITAQNNLIKKKHKKGKDQTVKTNIFEYSQKYQPRYQNQIQQQTNQQPKKHDLDVKNAKEKLKQLKREHKSAELVRELIPDESKYIAMDCEMVGAGVSGTRSVLARCSIVDFQGNTIYDEISKPLEKVTDFRTHVSGIRSKTLRKAIPFKQCQKDVAAIFKGKIIIGHALKNDFKALMITHPKSMIRDTAKYRPYMKRRVNGTKLYPKSLKDLSKEVLNVEIQTGEHDSIIDARAALSLYKKEIIPWEKCISNIKSYNGELVGKVPISKKGEDTKADKGKLAEKVSPINSVDIQRVAMLECED